jgi:hypothetical protein
LAHIARCAALAGLLLAIPALLPAVAGGQPNDFVPGTGDRSGLVNIGQGRDIYLECSGACSATVMLVSGAGVAADNWSYSQICAVARPQHACPAE